MLHIPILPWVILQAQYLEQDPYAILFDINMIYYVLTMYFIHSSIPPAAQG